jgi:hypothetical protein
VALQAELAALEGEAGCRERSLEKCRQAPGDDEGGGY